MSEKTPKPIGCVLISFNSRNEILLVLRDNQPAIPYPDTWNLPGGFLEGDETPPICIRREIYEEMEVILNNVQFFRKYEWPDCDEYIFWEQLDLDLAQVPLHEGQKLAYFSKEECDRTPLAFECNQIIDDFFIALTSLRHPTNYQRLIWT